MGMIRPYRDELAKQIKEAGQQSAGANSPPIW